jgi:hypothetical protein
MTNREKTQAATFYIQGTSLSRKPAEGVRYVKARTAELLVEHHEQLLAGCGTATADVRRIILEHWLPRGMIPFYSGVEFMKAGV